MNKRARAGIETFSANAKKYVDGMRIGLLTSPTGISSNFMTSIDICASLPNSQLTALFACEHGIRGEKPAGVLFEDEYDEEHQIPIFSLYGEHRKPTESMLEQVDAIVFDIQDIGVRFYTYLSTLVYTMESCAKFGKKLIVLDRPNPLRATSAQGGVLQEGFQSMVGAWKVPIVTGLTIGEFALMVNAGLHPKCDLQVVPLENWNRGMFFEETGLPWVLPSLNMPNFETALVYAGTCFIEGTNLSEGRGTSKPFQLIGAPWMKSKSLCETLNSRQLPGVYFHPYYYTPTTSKHVGQLCAGIQVHVTDATTYESVRIGLELLHHIILLHEEHFQWLMPTTSEQVEQKPVRKPFIDLLTGSDRVRSQIHTRSGVDSIIQDWEKEADRFRNETQKYWLYAESQRSKSI